MTLPPQGSPHYELRKRIAGCRERLRRARTTQREIDRAAPATHKTGGDSSADDEEEGRPRREVTPRSRG
ncbi:MAG: hypothetical protein LC746_03745 [Acidobacteria bacterium]|nr:hypothetical protein [Acidobacteriota bacterium]